MKSLTQKCFLLLLACNSLNRVCQWVQLKRCKKNLYSSISSYFFLWWALGKSSQRPWSSELASTPCPKSCLPTSGVEGSAPEPWTAPLLCDCRQPKGTGGIWGIFPERLHYCLDLGIPRASFSLPACLLFACILRFFNTTSSPGKILRSISSETC